MRRETNTRIRQHHWVKLVNEKIRRGQIGNVLTFFLSRKQSREVENKFKSLFFTRRIRDEIVLQDNFPQTGRKCCNFVTSRNNVASVSSTVNSTRRIY